MENAVMIAKILWPVLALMTIGMFTAPDMYMKASKELEKSVLWMYMGGILSALLGILMIGAYRAWVADWTIVVTLFGYLALIKGILLLVFPQFAIQMRTSLMSGQNSTMMWGVVYAIITLLLLYGVYMA